MAISTGIAFHLQRSVFGAEPTSLLVDRAHRETVRDPYNPSSGRDCVKSHRLCLHGTCLQSVRAGLGFRVKGLGFRVARIVLDSALLHVLTRQRELLALDANA